MQLLNSVLVAWKQPQTIVSGCGYVSAKGTQVLAKEGFTFRFSQFITYVDNKSKSRKGVSYPDPLSHR